jgi:HD superfamily phosphohydrolase
MLARYFMFSQVYFHPVRRIYDIHLKDFLKEWLPNNAFSTDLQQHMEITDNSIFQEAERWVGENKDNAIRIEKEEMANG